MKAEHASALVHETAKELSSLAPDEGRLLARLFDTASWAREIWENHSAWIVQGV